MAFAAPRHLQSVDFSILHGTVWPLRGGADSFSAYYLGNNFGGGVWAPRCGTGGIREKLWTSGVCLETRLANDPIGQASRVDGQ